MDDKTLEQWCTAMHLDLQRGLLVRGVPRDLTDRDIEHVLHNAIGILGKCQVLTKRYEETNVTLSVFCKLSEPIDYSKIPSAIRVGENTWKLVIRPPSEEEEIERKLKTVLQREGLSEDDVRHVGGESRPGESDQDEPKVEQESQSDKLGSFSGENPCPPEEEPYDSWIKHATEILKQWKVNDMEKQKRLMESLKGRAFDLIRILKLQTPDATVLECLQKLDKEYGSAETPQQTYVQFLTTFQHEGEKPSEFVVRVDKLLQNLVVKGAVRPNEVDAVRLAQVSSGLLDDKDLQVQIIKLEKEKQQIGYEELMAIVKLYENTLDCGNRTPQHRRMLSKTSSQMLPTETRMEPNHSHPGTKAETLKMPVEKWNTGRCHFSQKKDKRLWGQRSNRPEARTWPVEQRQRGPGIFCSNCGLDGHTNTGCTQRANTELVKQKLMSTSLPSVHKDDGSGDRSEPRSRRP
ncbi:paraneoplastic antigen Ma1 homolog [Vombatus ursinus]|uniref:paraneoplastic antigen Ma1 homolog n=1 Tax=Vombatus ursinus TaxID=29139 RepID=UPI000FFD1851|nr:paraneoplastic antigen Ma1 homolog [Vombatus ursinus]XP_027732813.1 paraneoplastic antigen Ma1 homolog [Vombatus ursinus]